MLKLSNLPAKAVKNAGCQMRSRAAQKHNTHYSYRNLQCPVESGTGKKTGIENQLFKLKVQILYLPNV